jgi:hypothetical protein
MLGESYDKELRKISLVDNIVGRRLSGMSDDLSDLFIDQLETSRFVLQVDEATCVINPSTLKLEAARIYIFTALKTSNVAPIKLKTHI